jgi:hypothetical protein
MARSTINASQVNEDKLEDSDGDTLIQVEEGADEDKIRFDTAGAERMIITDAGLVGIGTNDPDNTLHVKSLGTTHIKIESESGYLAALKVKAGGQSSAYVWQPASTSDLRFYVNGADRVHIDNDGNVGVGTTTPASTLTVSGSLALSVLSINSANDPGTTYTIAETNCVILVNTRPTQQGGIDSAITLTLPDASDNPGMVITVKDAGGYANTNNITISRAGNDNIEGISDTLVLNNIAQKTTLISDGSSSWYEIAS